MSQWNRLGKLLITAAVLMLLSACGRQTPAALDASSGSSHITNEQAAMQTEEFVSISETDANSGPSSVAGTAATANSSSPSSQSANDHIDSAIADSSDQSSPASEGDASSRSPIPPDAPQAGRNSSATAVPTGVKPDASAPNGNSSMGASPSAQSGSSQAPAASRPDSPGSREAQAHTVTLSVVGNAEWGTVVPLTEVEWNKGDTVRDILIRTLKSHKLAYETRGAGALFYVAGIDGLFEFDDGPLSGWKYRVNGEIVGVSAGIYELAPGDRVEWFYTTDGSDDASRTP